MASLHFPNLEALRVAVVSGVIPAAVAKENVIAAMPSTGGVWLKFAADLPGEAYSALQRLGAKAFGVLPEKETREYPCWPALLPLRPEIRPQSSAEVLFELRAERLPRFLATLERLATHSAFAFLDQTAVVRVTHSPEFVRPLAECVYHPVGRNAWCLVGHSLQTLPAKVLDTDGLTLVRPERDWRVFRDVHWHATRNIHPLSSESLLPAPTVMDVRLPLPLKLRRLPPAPTTDDSFWMARGGRDLVERYFCEWDERALRRLEFAIVRAADGGERVLVRGTRQVRTVPVLTEPFAAFVFATGSQRVLVPLGYRWVPQPPAAFFDAWADAQSLAWVEPRAIGYSIARTSRPAFRTLAECMNYSVPPSLSLQSREETASPFAFPGFVVHTESKPVVDSNAPPRLPDPAMVKKARGGSGWLQRLGSRLFPIRKGVVNRGSGVVSPEGSRSNVTVEHANEWAARRQHLERTLITMPATVADPIRAQAWRELAQLAQTMGHGRDAADAWGTAVWYAGNVPLQWLEAWYRCELDAARVPEGTPDSHLIERSPDVPLARVFAVRLTLFAAGEASEAAEHWRAMARTVQRFAPDLPIRHCWLARLAAAELARGDALALACERDALLGRLAENGPDAALDSPGFLRYQGKFGVERFHATAEWLKRTREAVQRWLKSTAGGGRLQWSGLEADLPSTRAYADLLFASGMAKLGDRAKCREWMEAAEVILNKAEGPGVEPLVHRHLQERFRLAIRSRHSQSGSAPKPPPLPDFAQQELSRYAVEKLEAHLSVFDHGRTPDPYGIRGLRSLLPSYDTATAPDVRTLLDEAAADRTAANLPPRVLLALESVEDAAIAGEVLSLLPLALELFPESLRGTSPRSEVDLPYVRRGIRAVELAARTAERYGLAGDFARLCGSLMRTATGGYRPAREVLHATANRIFAACRTLGLDAEISELLNVLGTTPSSHPFHDIPKAVGWFALGEDDRGWKILNEARSRLFEGGTSTEKERGDTALAYVRALAHAPAAMVPGRLEELFQRLDRIPMGGAASRYYALRPLEIIDGAIAAVVTSEFALDESAREWLAEDEFRLRRRIARDLEHALAADAP